MASDAEDLREHARRVGMSADEITDVCATESARTMTVALTQAEA